MAVSEDRLSSPAGFLPVAWRTFKKQTWYVGMTFVGFCPSGRGTGLGTRASQGVRGVLRYSGLFILFSSRGWLCLPWSQCHQPCAFSLIGSLLDWDACFLFAQFGVKFDIPLSLAVLVMQTAFINGYVWFDFGVPLAFVWLQLSCVYLPKRRCYTPASIQICCFLSMMLSPPLSKLLPFPFFETVPWTFGGPSKMQMFDCSWHISMWCSMAQDSPEIAQWCMRHTQTYEDPWWMISTCLTLQNPARRCKKKSQRHF